QCPSSDTTTVPCTDIIMFKSTDGGMSYSNPVRVNHDNPKSAADQFQPWMAITSKGQLDISYFDRRNDPNNYYIDTYLSRSNDRGAHFFDTRVTHSMWDPAINPPISPSGQFIGDYQGIVADDKAAIPVWNDTQHAQLSKTNKEGHFTKARSCKKPIRLRAKGGRKWHASLEAHLTPGRYRVSAVGLDQAGNLEKPSRRNTVTFRVR